MTNDVIVPTQAVSGATIPVTYTVTNLGAGATLTDQWTDTIWLMKTKGRPNPNQGDILLATIPHTGGLDVKAGYDQTVDVQIPQGLDSGTYYITPWVDPYGVVLQDELAVNVNPDDPNPDRQRQLQKPADAGARRTARPDRDQRVGAGADCRRQPGNSHLDSQERRHRRRAPGRLGRPRLSLQYPRPQLRSQQSQSEHVLSRPVEAQRSACRGRELHGQSNGHAVAVGAGHVLGCHRQFVAAASTGDKSRSARTQSAAAAGPVHGLRAAQGIDDRQQHGLRDDRRYSGACRPGGDQRQHSRRQLLRRVDDVQLHRHQPGAPTPSGRARRAGPISYG